MAMDFLEIYTRIQDQPELKGDVGKLRAKQLANRAYERLIGSHDWPWNKKYPAATVNIADTENIETFPADFRKRIKEGFLLKDTDGKLYPLAFREEHDFRRIHPNLVDGTAEGVPSIYTIAGWDAGNKALVALVGPWPDISYVGELNYFYSPPVLAGDTDEPHMPTGLRRFIVEIGIALAEEKLNEKNWLAIWARVDSEFERAIAGSDGEEDADTRQDSPRYDSGMGLRWIG